jgi:hypothetical protein
LGDRGGGRLHDFEGKGIAALGEFERDTRRRRRRAMFDGQIDFIARTTQVQIRVTPGMELGGAAQRLAGSNVAGGLRA